MARGHVQAKSILTADDFRRFFIDKVAKIRYSNVDDPKLSCIAVPPGCIFRYLQSIDRDDVIKLIMTLPDKQCVKKKVNFEIYVADRKATTCI